MKCPVPLCNRLSNAGQLCNRCYRRLPCSLRVELSGFAAVVDFELDRALAQRALDTAIVRFMYRPDWKMKRLLQAGNKLGISSRGYGTRPRETT